MKKILLLIFILTSVISYSQIKTGVVLYKVTLNKQIEYKQSPDLSVEMNAKLTKTLTDADRESEKITYTLVFSQDEGYFYANPKMIEGFDFSFLAGLNNNGKIKYYQNNTKKEYREYLDSKRLGVVILNKKVNYEWTLTKEVKMIDGYKCYKATSPSMSSKGEKNSNSKFNITAWYCPEIPIKYGPVGYADLPGLILELQFYKSTFTASKIDLNPEKLPIIDRLTEPKAITEEEYKEMYMGTLNKERYDAVKESEAKQNKK
jgi:GLPGLI family protein